MKEPTTVTGSLKDCPLKTSATRMGQNHLSTIYWVLKIGVTIRSGPCLWGVFVSSRYLSQDLQETFSYILSGNTRVRRLIHALSPSSVLSIRQRIGICTSHCARPRSSVQPRNRHALQSSIINTKEILKVCIKKLL